MKFLRWYFVGQRYNPRQLFILLLLLCLLTTLFKLYTYLAHKNNYDDFQSRLNVEDVRQLLFAGASTDVSLKLFDPLILEAWKASGYMLNPGSCLFLCHAVGPLSFAVAATEIRDKPSFLTKLVELGFTVTQFYNDEGERSHLFLLRSGTPLHINILYWSNAGYWRQYQLSGPPHHMAVVKQFITLESWSVLNMDRAYESFKTNTTVIDGFRMEVPSNIDHFSTDYKNAKFIPCNQTRATYFFSKHREDTSGKAKKFQHLAWKILAKCKTILDELKIPFWISSGTLLGFFRQCRIIPWALDVDLGVFIEDYSAALVPDFEAKGLKHVLTFGRLNDSFELSFKENGVKVDIFFFYTEGGTMWNGGVQASNGKKFKYIFPHFSMCWTEFLDLKVRIPCQTLDYVEANYGKGWFTPVRKWDWKASPANVIENGVWRKEDREQVIYVAKNA